MQTITKEKMMVAGVATAALVGYGIYSMMSGKEDNKGEKMLSGKVFNDVNMAKQNYLYKKEAFKRSGDVSKVSYKIGYALIRGGKSYHGRVEMKFTLVGGSLPDDLFADFHGESITGLCINGTYIEGGEPFKDHRIYFDK